MKTLIFSVGLLMVALQSLWAVEERMQLAEQYFEAGELERALTVYEEILHTPLSTWQKAVVQYNIGNVLLAQGHYAKAIEHYYSISLGPHPNPLLARRIQTNLALAFLLQGRRFIPTSLNQLEMSLFDDQEAYSSIVAASHADCELFKAEGGTECLLPDDLMQLKQAAKEQLMQHYARIKPLLAQEMTPQDGIPYLMVSLKQLLAMVNFLQSKSLNENERKSYVEFSLNKVMGWKPLWDNLQNKISQEPKQNQTMYAEASDHFIAGLQALRTQMLDKAEKEWQAAFHTLDSLVEKTIGMSAIQEVLRKLLAFYAFAYAQVPLQEFTLLTLQEEQRKALEASSSDLKPSLEAAQELLKSSLQALKANESPLSRFYLEEGRFQILELLRQSQQAESTKPQELLQVIIEAQHHALALNQLLHVVAKNRRAELVKHVEEAQKRVVEVAETFLPTVFAWQGEMYHAKASCQFHPWDEVLPQFDKALYMAQQAVMTTSSAMGLSNQEDALAKFKKALNILKKPAAAFTGTCEEGQTAAKKDEKSKKQAPQPQPQPQPALKDLIRNIMEMDEADRLPKQQPVMQMGGDKPW